MNNDVGKSKEKPVSRPKQFFRVRVADVLAKPVPGRTAGAAIINDS